MLRLGSSAAGALGWIASVAIHSAAALVVAGVISPDPAIEWVEDLLTREDAPPAESENPPDKAEERSSGEEPDEAEAPPPPPPEPEPEPEALKVRLGIDESDATDTDTWLGFATPSLEHGGVMMGFEQAQLSRAPGDEGRPPEPSFATAMTPTPPGDDGAPAPLAPVVAAPGSGGDSAADESRVAEPAVFLSPSATPAITLARSEPRPALDAPGATAPAPAPGVGATAGQPGPPEAAAAAAAPASSPGAAQAVDATAKAREEDPADLSQGAGGEREIGYLSDRDADAAAIKSAILASPGRPLAAKGLRIQTVRPQFSAFALATANPNDVVVRIWFNAEGRVVRAEVLQSSGRGDVDRPVLDAVYNWRATGAPLKSLAASGPDGRIEIVFRVTLRR